MADRPDPRRLIPGVDRLLARPWCRELVEIHGRPWVTRRLRAVLERLREGRSPVPGSDADFARLVGSEVAQATAPSLRPVINATGVVLHTNLGRAPLSAEAREAMAAATGYGNVELDLQTGERGSRYDHCVGLIRELTGADDAVVVNNGAAAVALALAALAGGKRVVISHGELVEIGGGFRIPEVVEAAGARLVSVGTTNRTRLADYARALEGGGAGAILKVHRSNFRISGFTEEVELPELVPLGAKTGTPVIHDLGSGLLVDSVGLGLPHEPLPADSVAAGADLVAFSGDKLLGGPQAGVLAGIRAGVARTKTHPLCRAFRCDKVTLAGLEATLSLYRDPERAKERIPVLRMITALPAELEERALAVLDQAGKRNADVAALDADVAAGESLVGGGTVPGEGLPTVVLRLPAGSASRAWMAALRAHEPPVIARNHRGEILIDLRTVPPEQDGVVASALAALATGVSRWEPVQ